MENREIIKGFTHYETNIVSVIKYIKKHPTKSVSYIAKKYGYSTRQIYRIKKRIKEDENSLYQHGNKNKTPHNKTSKKIEEKIIDGYNNYVKEIVDYRDGHDPGISIIDYYNNNCKQKIKCSYATAVRTLNNNLVATPYITRKTKALIKFSLKRLREEDILKGQNPNIQILNRLETISFNIDAYYAEKYVYGECVEIDACQHRWFNNKKYHLYHAIDSHSGRLLAAWMEEEETNHGYMQMLDFLFKKHGIPTLIKTDKRRSFYTDDETKSVLALAIEELGCSVTFDSNPTFKPKVERSFKNVQMSAPGYFFMKKWSDPEIFNANVGIYINWYNSRKKKLGEQKVSMFVKKTYKEINENFMLKIKRKVTNGIVQFKGKLYVPYDKENKRVLLEEKAKVSLYINKDGKLFFKGNNKIYRANHPSEKSLSDYELFCFRKKIDMSEPESKNIHKAYMQNVAMKKQIAQEREQLKLAWENYHAKKRELENWERNLAKNW